MSSHYRSRGAKQVKNDPECYSKGMGTKTIVPVEEYLRMSFEGPDREYVDGEIVERNLGELQHSRTQGRLIGIFYMLQQRHPLYPLPELRHRVTATRYRIPDVAVYAGVEPEESVPSVAPYVAVEIVSPDDRYSQIVLKLEEYRVWGATFIWLADPQARKIFVYDGSGLHEVAALTLPDYGVSLGPADIFGAAKSGV